MAPLRLLVAEGNAADVRRRSAALAGYTPGENYANVIRSFLPSAVVDICCPADGDAAAAQALGDYDGVAITGSALNAYHDIPEVRRQVEFSRAVFAAGVPFFGSCWGLQIAAVAAGGEVALNERGREVGYARDVMLTEAGRNHPMHRNRPAVFDAPAIHSDHIVRLPENSIVTAQNRVSPIQAAEIRFGNGVFWGVQYHPEFALNDIADVLVRYGMRLVTEGLFADLPALEAYARNLRILKDDPLRSDIAWQYAIGPDLTQPDIRLCEIGNWIREHVEPARSERLKI